jgi:hypothetical protein
MTRGLGIVLTPWGKIPGGYAPYGIAYDYKGAVDWYGSNSAGDLPNAPGNMDPRLDPQFFTTGEAGYYYDTHLGDVVSTKLPWFERMRAKWVAWKAKKGLAGFPTDFQLATIRGYLPVEGGWVQTQQGYMSSGPWLPPHGDPGWANPKFPVPMVPINGLGRALGQAATQPATVEDVMSTIAAHNDRAFALALVSTTAVAVSALLGVFRTLKLIREDARD